MTLQEMEPVVDNAIPGRDDKVVTEAIRLCGGDDSHLHLQVYAIWQTEILSKPQSDYPWTAFGSEAVQRTILMCGEFVENTELVKQVGELLWREIEHHRTGR